MPPGTSDSQTTLTPRSRTRSPASRAVHQTTTDVHQAWPDTVLAKDNPSDVIAGYLSAAFVIGAVFAFSPGWS